MQTTKTDIASFVVLIACIIYLAQICAGSTTINASIQNDIIVEVYNNTTIETANWEYLTILNYDEMAIDQLRAWNYIIVENATQTGPKSCIAELALE